MPGQRRAQTGAEQQRGGAGLLGVEAQAEPTQRRNFGSRAFERDTEPGSGVPSNTVPLFFLGHVEPEVKLPV